MVPKPAQDACRWRKAAESGRVVGVMLKAGLHFHPGKQASGSAGRPANDSTPGTLQPCQEMDGLQEPMDMLIAWGKNFALKDAAELC